MATQGSEKSCLVGHLLRLLNVTFDVLTVALGVLDVVTDLLVCVQFYHQQMWVSFAFCVLIMVNANVVFTHFTVEQGLLKSPPMFGRVGDSLHEKLSKRTHKRVLLYSLVFPFAQVMPALNWFLCTFVAKPVKKDQSRPKMLVESLYGALEEHWRTHGLFFVETLVESIPQSILQVVVITIQQQVTPIQVLSIILSIFSIVSKAYALSLSLDIRVFILKMLMLSYDVLAMFFIFASIFASPEESAAQCKLLFWENAHLSMLACIWIWYFILLCPMFVIGGFISGFYLPAHAAHNGESVGDALRQVILWASVWLPVMVLLPVPKLSPLVLWIHFNEPGKQTTSDARVLIAQLFQFVSGSKGGHWEHKVRRINVFLANHFEQIWKDTKCPDFEEVLLHCIRCCHKARQWCLTEPFKLSGHPGVYNFSGMQELKELPVSAMMSPGCTRTAHQGDLKQEMYYCRTCHLNVCDPCTQKCHVRHTVEYAGISAALCDCGASKMCRATKWLPCRRMRTQVDAAAPQEVPDLSQPTGASDPASASSTPLRRPKAPCCSPRNWLKSAFSGIERTFCIYWFIFLIVFIPFYLYGFLYPWLVLFMQVHPFNGLHHFTFYTMAAIIPFVIAFALWTLPSYLKFMSYCSLQGFGPLASLQEGAVLPKFKDIVRSCFTPSLDTIVLSLVPHAIACPDVCALITQFLDNPGPYQIVLDFRDMISLSLYPGRGLHRPKPHPQLCLELQREPTAATDATVYTSEELVLMIEGANEV